MTTYSAIRASDADREKAVAILSDAYIAGRLTLDEFHERLTAALSGRTWGALGELTSDLPHQARPGADAPRPATVGSDLAAAPDPGERTWRLLPLVPIAAVWLVVALSAQMPDSVVPVIIALLLLLRCTVVRRPVRRDVVRSPSGSHLVRPVPGWEPPSRGDSRAR
jgi:Domain of unknown function (DUF1707)